MAATAEGRRQTELHRRTQLAVQADTVRLVLAAWPLLAADDLDGTAAAWLAVTVPLVAEQRARSARAAARYLSTFRQVELRTAFTDPVDRLADRVPADRLVASLTATGPATLKRLTGRGVPVGRAAGTAAAAVPAPRRGWPLTAAGRRSSTPSPRTPQALGWRRVGDAAPCAFCAMLISRGPVYRADTVGFRAHDQCGCAAEPVYREHPPTAQERRLRQLWDETAAEAGEDDPLVAFRRKLREQRGGSPPPAPGGGGRGKPPRTPPGRSTPAPDDEPGPGRVHDPDGDLTAEERAAAEILAKEGRTVAAAPRRSGHRDTSPDLIVDGVPVEVKTLGRGADNRTVRNKMRKGKKQARVLLVDARGSGLTEAEATPRSGPRAGGILPGLRPCPDRR